MARSIPASTASGSGALSSTPKQVTRSKLRSGVRQRHRLGHLEPRHVAELPLRGLHGLAGGVDADHRRGAGGAQGRRAGAVAAADVEGGLALRRLRRPQIAGAPLDAIEHLRVLCGKAHRWM